MIPRFGAPPHPARRHSLRPGIYAILPRDGRLLLTEQATEDGPELQLPGGGVDPGEQTLPALLREIREETGHAALPVRHLATFRDFRWMPDHGLHAEKVCRIHLALPGPRHGPPTEPGHRAVWLHFDAAARALPSEGGRRVLLAWLAAGGRAARGLTPPRSASGPPPPPGTGTAASRCRPRTR